MKGSMGNVCGYMVTQKLDTFKYILRYIYVKNKIIDQLSKNNSC